MIFINLLKIKLSQNIPTSFKFTGYATNNKISNYCRIKTTLPLLKPTKHLYKFIQKFKCLKAV